MQEIYVWIIDSRTKQIVRGFFATLLEQEVPRSDLDSKLREIAGQYKELLLRLETVQSEDPQAVKLKKQAKQAVEAVDYAKAEALLNQAEERDMQLIEELERAVRQRRISTAAGYADNARLQRAKATLPRPRNIFAMPSGLQRPSIILNWRNTARG